MKKILTAACLFILTAAFSARPACAGSYAEDKKKVERYADELILAREANSELLAESARPVSEKAFSETYGGLYKKIGGLREKEGLIVTFSAIKYRNKQNSATPFEARLISSFRSDRAFKKFWTVTMLGGHSYSRFIKPLFAKKSCLACHGERDKRPAFIVKHYPGDKSYGFKDGELMGLISIYMPDEAYE